MLEGTILLRLGGKAKDYYRIVEKRRKYKRSSVDLVLGRDSIRIKVAAKDPVALISSLSGALKQLRVVGEVDETVDALLRREKQGKDYKPEKTYK